MPLVAAPRCALYILTPSPSLHRESLPHAVSLVLPHLFLSTCLSPSDRLSSPSFFLVLSSPILSFSLSLSPSIYRLFLRYFRIDGCVCSRRSVHPRAQICARRPHGDRERKRERKRKRRFWMDLKRIEICQGDGMGRYRFRKDGTSPRTSMERCTSSITTRGKLRGSTRGTGE